MDKWERRYRQELREHTRIVHRNYRIEVWAYVVGVLLILAGMVAYGCSLPTVEQQVADTKCPDGVVYTEWCGCDPPIYGDDC